MRNLPKSSKRPTSDRKRTIRTKRPSAQSQGTRNSRNTPTRRSRVEHKDDATSSRSAPSGSSGELVASKEYSTASTPVVGLHTSESYFNTLRRFRTLTLCAAMMLLAAFLVYAFDMTSGLTISLILAGLAALVEAQGALRLLKSHHIINESNAIKKIEAQKIPIEQVPDKDAQIRNYEPASAHSKVTAEPMSQAEDEPTKQRILKLYDKSRDILSRTGKLEKDELHSEAVLSFDRATRTVLTAVLLSKGVETQGKDIEGWLPHLSRIMQNMRLEDIAYLRSLRDRANRGYDATKAEAQRAKEITEPLIDEALKHLSIYLPPDDPQQNPHPQTPTTYKRCPGSSTSISQDQTDASAETNPAKTKEDLGANPKPFGSNVGADLISPSKSKEALQVTASIPRISDKLDRIIQSLTNSQTDTEESEKSNTNSHESASDANKPMDKVLLFERLGDFRVVTTRSDVPIVASFLTDDDPSREVKSTMDSYAKRYNTKASFIYVTSKSQDIVRECKIKSYPTVLLFYKGKDTVELKSNSPEELNRDLTRTLGIETLAESEGMNDKNTLLKRAENAMSPDAVQGGNMQKLEVTDPH